MPSVLWDAPGGCGGRLWDAVGCSGKVWGAPEGFGRLWEALGDLVELWEALGGSGSFLDNFRKLKEIDHDIHRGLIVICLLRYSLKA